MFVIKSKDGIRFFNGFISISPKDTVGRPRWDTVNFGSVQAALFATQKEAELSASMIEEPVIIVPAA